MKMVNLSLEDGQELSISDFLKLLSFSTRNGGKYKNTLAVEVALKLDLMPRSSLQK
jgi:hypothetical protein